MPLIRIAQKLARKLCCPDPREQEETGPGAILPGSESDELRAMEPGRPYQAYVENEVRKYWREISNVDSLTKPSQPEIRAAAMPILCLALRNRFDSRRHHAVACIAQHALERGWIKSPFSEALESPSYIEALIELVRDTRWSAWLELTISALVRNITDKLQIDCVSPNEAATMITEVRSAPNIDRLCWMYEQLAIRERQHEWAKHQPAPPEVDAAGTVATHSHVPSPTFNLGEKQHLDAEAVTQEIKQYLRAFCHPFVGQAVNEMETGCGEPVAGYPGVQHVSAGIYKLGNCSIFYQVNKEQQQVSIVGLGFHLGWRDYRLEYATGELAGCGRILQLP